MAARGGRGVLSLGLATAIAGCAVPDAPVAPARAAPAFSAERFFAGETRGEGRLRILVGRPQPFAVRGHGRVEPDGTLVLDQEVTRGHGAPTHREWRIRPVPGGYLGTLSDATGPVHAEVVGNRLHIRYPMGYLRVEQWITLRADGQAAANRMTVRRLGIPVARGAELIRRTGAE